MTSHRRIAALTCGLLLGLPLASAEAADFGSRTLREGMSGNDVTKLQRHLTRVGFRTTADGQFGPRTRRSVERFEQDAERRVNGVVSRADANALREAVREAKRGAVEEPAVARATLTSKGLAVAPASAPPEIVAVIEAGNRIARKRYKYGGGHRRWRDSGYDCSGSISYALHGGGLLDRPLDSTGFMRWGRRGRGKWITIRANRGHAYMVVAGLRFDTSARKRTGSRWTKDSRSARGYVKRHPAGL